MLDLLYWNTQLMLLVGEIVIMLLTITLPTLWVIGATLELIDKIKLRNKLQKVWVNYDNKCIKEYKFLDKDKRKDK